MKKAFVKTKNGIMFKIFLINAISYITVGVLIIGVFYSYRYIETALTEVFDSHTKTMAQNAHVGKELAAVLVDTGYLVSAFYRNDELLNRMETQLTIRLEDLQKLVKDEHLRKSLNDFKLTINTVWEQGERINQIHRKLASLHADFNATISDLDKKTAGTSLQHLAIMIPELHKLFLEINLQLFDMGLDHFEADMDKQQQPILFLLDDLELLLKSLTSPFDEISGCYERLKKTVRLYRETVTQLYSVAGTFKMRQAELKKMENPLLTRLEEIDAYIANSMTTTTQTMMSKIEKSAAIGITVAVSLLVGISIFVFWIGQTITRSINKAAKRFKEIASGQGDLTVSLAVDAKDETAILARQFNRFIAKLRKMIRAIGGNAVTLSRFAIDLTSVSERMSEEVEAVASKSGQSASAAEMVSSKIRTMAVATEEIDENINTISSATEQMSQNMNSVASSVEEMNTVVSTISENSQEGAGMTDSAKKNAQIASDAMNELNDAVNEISTIIDVIGTIASHTNLLALNARIEAASAGDAGRGFAVVADEIKTLAVQSAEAASEVTDHIESVQKRTGNAVKVFADLFEIISAVNHRIGDISNAVRQQSQTNREISANVLQADTGISDISSSITDIAFKVSEMSKDAGDAADAAVDVAKNIMAVSQASESSSRNARKVSTSAGELAQVASQLQKLVIQFKVDKKGLFFDRLNKAVKQR
ncbi:methyl-accepting chemotaxis protein [Desulfococcaceae bacterium HSG9]|nr:methyl-accepting chemotaxis protein [Desulfococcaceae bacterium HSG9]